MGPCHSLILLALVVRCALSMAFRCSFLNVSRAPGRVSPICWRVSGVSILMVPVEQSDGVISDCVSCCPQQFDELFVLLLLFLTVF